MSDVTESQDFSPQEHGRTAKDLCESKSFDLPCHGSHFSEFKGYTGDSMVAQIMTTRELAKYLRLHEITICKLCREGKIPSVRIGRVWRFDREAIDQWIARG